MAASVVRLTSKGHLLRQAQAADMRQALLQFEPQAPALVGQVLALIDRNTAAERGWSFVMLSPSQNRLVVRWIQANSKRPRVAAALWAECFCYMRTDTGEVVMTRQQMMDATSSRPSHVSEVLAELVGLGALIRRQEGRTAQWFMNPTVGTHLGGVAREKSQREAPPLLSVMEGGRQP